MKKRVNITMDPNIAATAETMWRSRGYGSMTAFLEELVRQEADRRGIPINSNVDTGAHQALRLAEDFVSEAGPTAQKEPPPAAAVRYSRKKQSAKDRRPTPKPKP